MSPRHRLAFVVLAALGAAGPASAQGVAPTAPTGARRSLLAAPALIEQGRPVPVAATIALPAGPEVTVSASPGALGAPHLVGGAWVIDYLAPSPAEPGALLLHAAPRGRPCEGQVAVVRRATHALHAIRTEPGSRVSIFVGGREAGAARADGGGRAEVPTLLYPEDRTYEVRAIDELGNASTRSMALPPPRLPPPLLAHACRAEVPAGEAVELEVAAVDHLGQRAPVTFELPPGVAIEAMGGELPGRYRLRVGADRAGGPMTLSARSGASLAPITITVLPRPPLVPAVAVAGPAPGERAGLGLGLDAGGESNLGERAGVTIGASLQYRPRALDGRLRPRLAVGLVQLWGGAGVERLVVPLEAGAAATVLRLGRWDLDLELGLGAALSRTTGGSGPEGGGAVTTRALGSLSTSLAVRRHLGRGALTARLGWRLLLGGDDLLPVEQRDNRGLLGLSLGGEVDLL